MTAVLVACIFVSVFHRITAVWYIYDTYSRSVLLYDTEACGLMERLENVLMKCDKKMLGYLAGITWRSGMSSTAVAER